MKTKKSFIILGVVFIILGVAFYFVTNYNPEKKDKGTTVEAIIFSESLENMEELSVSNEYGSYTLSYSKEGLSFNGIKENINAPLISSMFNYFTKLPAISAVNEYSNNLSDYGLFNPISEIKLKTKNGETVFYLGNKVTTGNSYYFKTDKSNTIYQLPSYIGDMLCQSPDAFRNLTIVLMDQTAVREFTITKDGQTLSVAYKAPSEGSYPGAVSTWKITSPFTRDADNSLVKEKILSQITSIIADSVAADNPSDLSGYNFNGDRVMIKSDADEISFQVGFDGESSYIYIEKENMVYKISPSKLSFMDIKPFDILEKFTHLIDIESVSAVEIKTSDTLCVLNTENYTVDGVVADEKAFKSMYAEILALSVDGMIEKPVSLSKNAPSVIFNLKDGTSLKLEYSDYDDLNYAVFENGQSTFYMKKTKLSSMLEKLEKLKKDPSSPVA